MVTAAARTGQFTAAGALHTLLAPWAFFGDVLVSKRGDLAVAYRLKGVDYEGLDQDTRQRVGHRVETALRVLPEDWRVFSYVTKRKAPPLTASPVADPVVHAALQRRVAHWNANGGEIYTLDLTLVLQYEGLLRQLPRLGHVGGWRAPWRWARPAAIDEDLQAVLDRALGHVDQITRAVTIHLADTVRPTRLSATEFFRFLRHLLNYDPVVADAAPMRETALDVALASTSLTCDRTHMDVGATVVQMLSMVDAPVETHAHILEDLYAIPGEFVACLEWRRLDPRAMRRQVHARRRHAYNKRISMVNYLQSNTPASADLLVDLGEGAVIDQLGQALVATETEGHFWGECSLTLAILGPDLRATTAQSAEALKVLSSHDGQFHRETYNQLNAWLSMIPGNTASNVRRLPLFETHAADLGFWFTLDQGDRTAPALGGRDALFAFDTPVGMPYFFNLHVGDVGHALVLGASGSGKSYLVAGLVLAAQKYQPATVIFDVGHSYRGLANLLGASYLTLGVRPPGGTINPFAFEPTPEQRHFQQGFVSVLLSGADGYVLTDDDQQELYDCLSHLPMLAAPERRLRTVSQMLPVHLARRLDPWVEGGQYGGWFDHADDTFTAPECQVFDFSAMANFPVLFEPVLFYVLHRTMARVGEPGAYDRFFLAVLDEAWAMVTHPALRAYVETALKTWRKRHAAIILATQAVEDFARVGQTANGPVRNDALLRTALEQCPTTLFLANPKLDKKAYAEWFGLSDTELAVIGQIQAKRGLVLKHDGLLKRLILDVDPETHAVLSGGGPRLVERRVG